jgi:hypothetical protein
LRWRKRRRLLKSCTSLFSFLLHEPLLYPQINDFYPCFLDSYTCGLIVLVPTRSDLRITRARIVADKQCSRTRER